MPPPHAPGPGRRREAREVILAPVGRFAGDCGDHAALDAQIGKIAVAQAVKFPAGLAIQGRPARRVLQAADHPGNAGSEASTMSGRVGMSIGHFVSPLFVFVCEPVSGVDIVFAFVDSNLSLML